MEVEIIPANGETASGEAHFTGLKPFQIHMIEGFVAGMKRQNEAADFELRKKVNEIFECGFAAKLMSVKMFKEQFNWGLKDSKEFIDYFLGIPSYSSGNPGVEGAIRKDNIDMWPAVFVTNLDWLKGKFGESQIMQLYPAAFTPEEMWRYRGTFAAKNLGII